MRSDSTDLQRQYLATAFARDGWFWIKKQAKTFDEHDPGSEAKPFPSERLYLEKSYQIWQKYAFTIEEKSRQMLETWRVIVAHVHLAQFNTFSRVLLSSKDEDDALKLLDRAWFVYDNQSQWLKEMYPAKLVENKIQFYHRINGQFRKSSVIEALAQGADETRSMVGSAVVLDEAAFCPHFEGFLQAAIPMTVTGKVYADPSKAKGGRLTILSSANPGAFELAIRETKRRAVRHEIVIPGLEVWHPENLNDFAAIRLHYSADPTPEIVQKVEEAKRKYIALGALPAFRKEYEIDYDALSGERIWPTLNRDLHELPSDWVVPDDWTRFRVIDPGYDHPCAINWFAVSEAGWRGCVDKWGRPLSVIVCYRELHLVGHRIDEIYDLMTQMSEDEYYNVTLIDPSSDIHKGNEAAGFSIYEKLVHLGVRGLVKANNAVDSGLDEVRMRLAVHGQSPALLIKRNCEHTWRQSLMYHYKKRGLMQENAGESKPWKVDDDHPDVIRYACQWRPLPKKPKKTKNPMRSFGWHVEQNAERTRLAQLLGNGNFSGRIIP